MEMLIYDDMKMAQHQMASAGLAMVDHKPEVLLVSRSTQMEKVKLNLSCVQV